MGQGAFHPKRGRGYNNIVFHKNIDISIDSKIDWTPNIFDKHHVCEPNAFH